MRTRIVRVGNSRGVRIPKPLLEQCGLCDEVDLAVEGNRLIIRPARHPRAGWEEAIRKLADAPDDAGRETALWRSFGNRWDGLGWRW